MLDAIVAKTKPWDKKHLQNASSTIRSGVDIILQ